jgi:hypothetical protein
VARLRSRPAIATFALALAALSVGCGDDGAREGPPFEPANIEDPQSLLVENRDIKEVGPQTPYAAVLRWWQALQLAKVEGVRQSYASRVSRAKTRHQILTFQPRFSQPLNPQVTMLGNRATMDVTVRTAFGLRGTPTVVRISDFPARFELLRKAAGWKLLASSYRNFLKARPFLPHPAG